MVTTPTAEVPRERASEQRSMDANAKVAFPAIFHFIDGDSGKRWHYHVTDWQDLSSVKAGAIDLWPKLDFWVPGGLFDCAGQEFVFRNVSNIPALPSYLKPVVAIIGARWLLGRFEAQIEMDGPFPLSLDQFKERLKKLAGTTLVQGITRRKLKELIELSSSYKEAIYVMCGPDAFAKSNPPWTPVPGTPLYEREQAELVSLGKLYKSPAPSRSNWPLTLIVLFAFAVLFAVTRYLS
jgi:hypothetical protein